MESVNIPLSPDEIFEYAKENFAEDVKNSFNGKTPNKTLAANLYTNSLKDQSIFMRFGGKPVKLGLKEKSQYYIDDIENNGFNEVLTNEETKELYNKKNETYKEKDLHKFLVSFYSESLYCKTISSSKSDNNTSLKNKFLHPDIMGVKYIREFHNKRTLNLMKHNSDKLFELYSFEMKRKIDMPNIREYFLQAAINSSWANYGYLVALEIDDRVDDLMAKLNRILGIGVIKLNVKSYNESEILYEAKIKEIDWANIDELIKLNNKDINEFFDEIVFECKSDRDEVMSKIYDELFESELEGEKYAKQHNIPIVDEN